MLFVLSAWCNVFLLVASGLVAYGVLVLWWHSF